jgi:hypothetical protein
MSLISGNTIRNFTLHLARPRTFPQHTLPLLPLLRSRPGGVHKACIVRSPGSDKGIPNCQNCSSGGEGGIRTHGTVPRSQHFQCCQFNHSCTSPGCPTKLELVGALAIRKRKPRRNRALPSGHQSIAYQCKSRHVRLADKLKLPIQPLYHFRK